MAFCICVGAWAYCFLGNIKSFLYILSWDEHVEFIFYPSICTSCFLGNLARLVRQYPWSALPEIVADYVQVFYHDPGLGPALLVVFVLRLGLLHGLSESVNRLCYRVATRFDEFIL